MCPPTLHPTPKPLKKGGLVLYSWQGLVYRVPLRGREKIVELVTAMRACRIRIGFRVMLCYICHTEP